jgi:iron complex transport system substrate-binding protein
MTNHCKRLRALSVLLIFTLFFNCKKATENSISNTENSIEEAKGFSLYKYPNFKILTVQNYYPNSTKQFRYVLAKSAESIPDSLRSLPFIQTPITRIALTSTTHIPSLVLLGESSRLVAFPNTNYISSPTIRKQIEKGKVIDLGTNQQPDLEKLAISKAQVLIGYQIDQSRNLEEILKSVKIPILLNADWNEQTALGKAEYIKFFGALFEKDALAEKQYNQIKTNYLSLKKRVSEIKNQPSVMAGALFEDSWYLPQGNSWGAQFIKDAGAKYIYEKTTGTGSLRYDLEKVYLDCKNADFWIGPGQFESRTDLLAADTRYSEFKAFQENKIFSYSAKKGATGGVLFYELASNRPDLVLRDLVHIFHPDLLPNHKLYFFTHVR